SAIGSRGPRPVRSQRLHDRPPGAGRCICFLPRALHLCGGRPVLLLQAHNAQEGTGLRPTDLGNRIGRCLMALHFERAEFDARRDRLMIEMAERKLDAMLLFAQESMYWLTGYDTFGFCFFQCLVVKANGEMVLLTRSADLR